jgi:hypothetical protein
MSSLVEGVVIGGFISGVIGTVDDRGDAGDTLALARRQQFEEGCVRLSQQLDRFLDAFQHHGVLRERTVKLRLGDGCEVSDRVFCDVLARDPKAAESCSIFFEDSGLNRTRKDDPSSDSISLEFSVLHSR